ncbi:DEKNAAC102260 [Brettanomyces naardenensis]|uniref:DEKNAAC102260 n=1 Tax=Brettanomyces naardenensis TaxID=13370 RepID=A0A448YKF9_BRENA|nr:DEKNAAC102260 [Brettanomyces naardenensis]
MKVNEKSITVEERKEHDRYVKQGGVKGALLGTAISIGVFGLLRYRFPKRLAGLTTSVKTGAFVIPPAFCTAVGGATASENYGKSKYENDVTLKTAEKDEIDEWNAMNGRNKAMHILNSNKYKVITGLWALSMWGSWKLVDRDPLLTRAQKFYDARMYAQFITIALLLGSIGLSMADEKNEKKSRKFEDEADDDYMRRVMFQSAQAEQAKRELQLHKEHLAKEKADV